MQLYIVHSVLERVPLLVGVTSALRALYCAENDVLFGGCRKRILCHCIALRGLLFFSNHAETLLDQQYVLDSRLDATRQLFQIYMMKLEIWPCNSSPRCASEELWRLPFFLRDRHHVCVDYKRERRLQSHANTARFASPWNWPRSHRQTGCWGWHHKQASLIVGPRLCSDGSSRPACETFIRAFRTSQPRYSLPGVCYLFLNIFGNMWEVVCVFGTRFPPTCHGNHRAPDSTTSKSRWGCYVFIAVSETISWQLHAPLQVL